MDVLITGGAGFIGSRLVAAYLAAGARVRVLDDLSGAAAAIGSIPAGAEPVAGDVRDPDVVRDCLRGVDVVSHQAAKVGLGGGAADLADYSDRNVTGTAVVLAAAAAAGVRHLVLASSMVVYGEGGYRCTAHGAVRAAPRSASDLDAGEFEPRCPRCAAPLWPCPVDEDAPPDPRNGYAVSKLAAERLAACWARETGGTAAALRYHNVYGPGMPAGTRYAGVAAIFRAALSGGRPPRVFEDGAQRRDFVHVDDVAAAGVAATSHRPAAGTLRAHNIGSGVPRTVGELAAALATACGGPRPVVTGEYRLGDVRHITADTRRAATELGWQPRIPFAEGVAALA